MKINYQMIIYIFKINSVLHQLLIIKLGYDECKIFNIEVYYCILMNLMHWK